MGKKFVENLTKSQWRRFIVQRIYIKITMIKYKHIDFQAVAPYATYGNFSEQTQAIWVVFHGYGQLAQRFIRRFDILNPETHVVIAPQGLSKFYLKGTFSEVGASWMTKEDREIDIQNQQIYIQSVFQKETQSIDLQHIKINILGFSQGVTTACRWALYHQIPFDKLVMWAGGFPHEITEKQILKPNAEIIALIGDQDSFYDSEMWEKQLQKIETYLKKPQAFIYEGKHEISREILQKIV